MKRQSGEKDYFGAVSEANLMGVGVPLYLPLVRSYCKFLLVFS